MAKKRTVRKAGKKTAKKAGKKKTGKRKTVKAPTSAANRLTFKCANGCTVSNRHFHMGIGATINLIATNTDATIHFVGASPFVSGTNPITVLKGTPQSETVGYATGHFQYTLVCANPTCRSSATNPEMIVP